MSNAAFWGGLVVTYLLTTSELSERTARTTVLLMCVFPTAHFFLMPYSESLFLLLSVTAFWGARRRRWCGRGRRRGAGGAHPQHRGRDRAGARDRGAAPARRAARTGVARFLAAAATGCGLFAYLGSWWLRAGEWLAPVTFQANWERTFSWPWVTLWDGTGDAFRYLGEINGGYWLLDWLIVIPMLAASVYALVRLRPAYGVYLWSALLIPLTFVFQDRPLMSMPRFVLPLFPAFWGLALGLERLRIPGPAALVVCAFGLGILSVADGQLVLHLLTRLLARPGRPYRMGSRRRGPGGRSVTIRVAIADDHSLVRQGLRRYLDMADGIEVVGEAANGQELVDLVIKEEPDIALVDIRMPEMDGLEAARKIRETHPKTGVIMLTAYDDRQFVVEAVRSGARGYVLKARDAEHLIQTVRLVAGGNMVIDPQLVVALAEELSQAKERDRRAETLTAREIEVLQLLAFGHTNRDIAERLYISPDTVKTHLEHIFEKLGASDRTAAVAEALRRRLIE